MAIKWGLLWPRSAGVSRRIYARRERVRVLVMPFAEKQISDPVIAALTRAPRVEKLTSEQRAELDKDTADIAAGRARLIPHADVPRVLEELGRKHGG